MVTAASTGNKAEVILGVETELKVKPLLVVVGSTEGGLRLIALKLDVAREGGGTSTGPWALLSVTEGGGELTAGEEDDRVDERGKDGVWENGDGRKPGVGVELGRVEEVEQGPVTVIVESTKTVCLPSAPAFVKVAGPSGAAEFGRAVGDGDDDGGAMPLPTLTLVGSERGNDEGKTLIGFVVKEGPN